MIPAAILVIVVLVAAGLLYIAQANSIRVLQDRVRTLESKVAAIVESLPENRDH